MGAVYGALSYLYWAYAVGAGYGDYWFYIYYDYLNYNDDGYHVSGPYFYEFGWGYFVYGGTLPIPGGGPKADTYRPNHILQWILLSFTITTQAQVLLFITGGLVTPPGCMENSSTPLDTHTVRLDITNGGWNTVATTMLDFTMKVPPFKALL